MGIIMKLIGSMIVFITAFTFSGIANALDCETPNQNAKPIKNIPPTKIYPKEAEKRHLDGSVTIFVDIDKDGNVTDAKITKFSSPTFNDPSILGIVKSIKFTPAKKECVFIPSNYTFNMSFKFN